MKLSPHNLKRYKDLTLLLLKHAPTSISSKFREESPGLNYEDEDDDEDD